MSMRLSLGSFSCAVLLLTALPCASAQSFFLTPIPNQPFSAIVTTERTALRRNGSVAQLKSIRAVARDTRGRIHNELRAFIPIASGDTPAILRIHLYDPQTRISTEINVPKRIFWTITMNHPPSTEPPSIRFAAPDGNTPPNEFTRQEDLGYRDIDSVPAHGIRESQTITDGDTGKQVTITDEYWYSQDLRIYLLIKHSDPRKGTTTMTVSQITRTEPDPGFFEIPEGYTRPDAQAPTQKTN